MEHLQKFEHICTVSKYLTRRPGTPPAAGDFTGILSTHRYLPAMYAMLSGVHHERKVAERRTPLNRLNGTVTGRGLRCSCCCCRHKRAYSPFCCSSPWCVPCSTTLPASSTSIFSAS